MNTGKQHLERADAGVEALGDKPYLKISGVGCLACPWMDMGDGQGHGMSLKPLVQDVPATQECQEGFTGRLQFWMPGESMWGSLWRETNIPSLPLE